MRTEKSVSEKDGETGERQMNYQYFQHLYRQSQYDEIEIIGKDVSKKNQWYHILGMTLKNKQVSFCVLEMADSLFEEEDAYFYRCTPRSSMKRNLEHRSGESLFMRIRELGNKEQMYQVSGASSGPLKNSDYGEAYFMFLRMMEAGWSLSENSPFYDMDWDMFVVTNIELQGEFDTLPEWTEDMEALVYTEQEGGLIEQTVRLECGKEAELEFVMDDGRTAHCFLNKIFIFDMWEEQEKKFADPEYKERILKHISEEEFEEMKRNCFATLEEQGLKGQCYMALYYECDQDLNLDFYDREYLDRVPEPREGSCTSIAVMMRPEQKTGIHGLPLRGTVIQKPVSKDTVSIEAELFSYTKKIEQKVEQL